MTHRTYSILDLSVEFKLSHRALRFYEDKGLVRPFRTTARQRVYSEGDRALVAQIVRLSGFGFSLAEVKKCLGFKDVHIADRIADARDRTREDIAALEKRLGDLTDALAKVGRP